MGMLKRTLRAGGVSTLGACLLWAPSAAQADIYWGTQFTIGRSASDGSGANAKFITKRALFPTALATDGQFLYWASAGNTKRGAIGRSLLSGKRADPLYLPGISSPIGLAANSSAIYWSTRTGKIGRAWIRKGVPANAKQKFITGLPHNATSLAVGSDYIYWLDGQTGNIGRATMSGWVPDANFIQAGANLTGLAVDDTHIYWSKSATDGSTSVVRANLDGSGATELVTGIRKSLVAALAVDSKHIYWTVPGWWAGEKSVMGRANLDGSGVVQRFLSSSQLVPVDKNGVPRSMTPGLVVTE